MAQLETWDHVFYDCVCYNGAVSMYIRFLQANQTLSASRTIFFVLISSLSFPSSLFLFHSSSLILLQPVYILCVIRTSIMYSCDYSCDRVTCPSLHNHSWQKKWEKKEKIKRKENVSEFKRYQYPSHTSTILIDTPLFILFPYGLDSILVLNCLKWYTNAESKSLFRLSSFFAHFNELMSVWAWESHAHYVIQEYERPVGSSATFQPFTQFHLAQCLLS